MLFDQTLYLEERGSHLYAEGFGLIAARDGTAVIARKHDDGLALEVRSEDPLAGSKEVVAVGKGVHRPTSS